MRRRGRARRAPVEQAHRVGGVVDRRHLGDQLVAWAARRDPRRRPERLGEPIGERPELEEVEQPLDLVGLGRDRQRVEVDGIERRVAAEHHHVEVLAGSLLAGGEALAELRGLLVDVGEDPVEPAVLVDQLGGRLLADARHAGQVVGRVAAQRRVLRVQRRAHAGLLLDPGLVVERVVADAAPVVEHLDVRVGDELIAVAVAGDDDDVVAAGDDARRRPTRSGRRPPNPTGRPAGSRARRAPGARAPSAGAGCRAPPRGWPCTRGRRRGGTSARGGRRRPARRRASAP